jgi:hypothetical protein
MPDIEVELERALAEGRLGENLSAALRSQHDAADGKRPDVWGWSLLYDVTLWNREATAEQVRTFVEGVRRWITDPTRETLGEIRKGFVTARMNVNGRGVGGVDLAAILHEMGTAALENEDA